MALECFDQSETQIVEKILNFRESKEKIIYINVKEVYYKEVCDGLYGFFKLIIEFHVPGVLNMDTSSSDFSRRISSDK